MCAQPKQTQPHPNSGGGNGSIVPSLQTHPRTVASFPLSPSQQWIRCMVHCCSGDSETAAPGHGGGLWMCYLHSVAKSGEGNEMWSTIFPQHPPLLGSQPLLRREIPWLCHGPASTSSLQTAERWHWGTESGGPQYLTKVAASYRNVGKQSFILASVNKSLVM